MSLRTHWERVSGGMACIPVVYVHKRTGEVRYDKPTSEDKLARSLTDAALFKEYDNRVATNAHSPPETLLEDWERHEDQQEVLTAWYQHTKTGETCYDKPLKPADLAKSLSNAALNREIDNRRRLEERRKSRKEKTFKKSRLNLSSYTGPRGRKIRRLRPEQDPASKGQTFKKPKPSPDSA
jgi:hypothetical protein